MCENQRSVNSVLSRVGAFLALILLGAIWWYGAVNLFIDAVTPTEVQHECE